MSRIHYCMLSVLMLTSLLRAQTNTEKLFAAYEQSPDSVGAVIMQSIDPDLSSTPDDEKVLWYWVSSQNAFDAFDINQAITYLERAIEILWIHDDRESLTEAYNLLGQAYAEISYLELAASAYYESLKLGKSLNLHSQVGDTYINLADMYHYLGDREITNQYLHQAEEAYALDPSNTYGQIYVNLGRAASNGVDLQDIPKVFDDIIRKLEVLDDTENIAFAYTVQCSLYIEHEALELATMYANKALSYSKEHGLVLYEVLSKEALARIYLLENQYDQAKSLLYSIISDYPEYPDYAQTTFLSLSDLYENQGRSDSALFYLNKYTDLTQTLEKQVSGRVLSDIGLKYENELQEYEIARATKSRAIIIIASLTSLLAITFLYGWYYQRQKSKKRIAEKELQIAKEKAENLAKLDQLKDQFFTNISHELRTPLTLIIDPLHQVEKIELDAPTERLVSIAKNNSENLLSLVNEIMDLSKIEAGKYQVNKEQIEIVSLVRRTFSAFSSSAELRGITLSFQSNIEQSTFIESDPAHIEKIVNNLTSNAVKFSPDHSTICAELNQVEEGLLIKVKDQGVGISKENQIKIFDRFYQVEQNGNYKGGTGVGLALSKELSQLLGGNLTVESELGQGSTFIFTLPTSCLVSPPMSGVQGEKEQKIKVIYESLLINGESPRILLIEDNKDMSDYLHSILSTDYRVSRVYDGVKALQLLQKEKYDLIISDVMMPGLDGFSLREKAQEVLEEQDVPYIFLTARSLSEDVLRGLRLGVDDYITKPFSSDELIARVYNLIKQKKYRLETITQGDRSEQPESVRFLKEAEGHVLENLSDSSFRVDDFASNMNLSARQLNRKLKPLTGLSAAEFILELRLQKARRLIERKVHHNISDVRYEVGIESASYFSRKFKERYGRSPKDMLGQSTNLF